MSDKESTKREHEAGLMTSPGDNTMTESELRRHPVYSQVVQDYRNARRVYRSLGPLTAAFWSERDYCEAVPRVYHWTGTSTGGRHHELTRAHFDLAFVDAGQAP